MSRQHRNAPHMIATTSRTADGHDVAGLSGWHAARHGARLAAMDRAPRLCELEGLDESATAERQARARVCKCDLCVEARSFVAVNVTHSTRPEITDRIAALMWRVS